MANSNPSVKKKPYQRPQVVRHGSIRELTKAKGGTKSDGGGIPRTRL